MKKVVSSSSRGKSNFTETEETLGWRKCRCESVWERGDRSFKINRFSSRKKRKAFFFYFDCQRVDWQRAIDDRYSNGKFHSKTYKLYSTQRFQPNSIGETGKLFLKTTNRLTSSMNLMKKNFFQSRSTLSTFVRSNSNADNLLTKGSDKRRLNIK